MSVVSRYDAECDQRDIDNTTAILRNGATNGLVPENDPVEWDVAALQCLIPLRELFMYVEVMDSNESARNFESAWPVIDFLQSIERLDALGGELLIDVVPTPGRTSRGQVCGIANIVFNKGGIASQYIEREANRINAWQDERRKWGKEFDERRLSHGKRTRGERLLEWIRRAPCPKYSPPDIAQLLVRAMTPIPGVRATRRKGLLTQGLAEWRMIWQLIANEQRPRDYGPGTEFKVII
jgi:hypothetical protein